MAATVGSVIINLKARTAQFDAGMAKGTSTLKRFATSAASVAKSLGTVAVAAAAIGTIALVKQNLGAIDSTTKLARQLGITTEALVGLRFAADQTGAGAKTLDAGLATMSKRLGEVAQFGTGLAAKGLELLKIDIEDIINLDTAAQFTLIAEKMKDVENVSIRAAAASAIFSKANQTLALTAELGAEGLAKMQRRAEFLGFTFSELEGQKIEAANDAFDEFKKSVGGLAVELTIALAPTLKLIADSLTSIVQTGRSVIGFFGDFIDEVRGLAGANIALERSIEGVGTAMKKSRTRQAALAAADVEAARAEQRLKDIAVREKDLTTDAQRTFAIMRQASDNILRFGMSADQLAVAELRSLRGVGEADIAFLRRQQARFAELEATSKAREDAAAAEEARQDSLRDFFTSAAPAALERGTAAAFSAANRIRLESGERGIPGLVRKADEQIRIQKEMNRHLQRIEDEFDVLEEAPF